MKMTSVCDVLIVGGGVLGLWAAKFAADAGLTVTLVDKNECGSGGSHGVLGALLPHLPNAMNEKKRFQLEALVDLPDLAKELEEQTDLTVGYQRCGRLMPIRLAGFEKRVERCAREAPDNWDMGAQKFRFERIDAAIYKGWINTELAPLGLAYDTLSARAAPRLVTQALKASIKDRVSIVEGFEFGAFDEQTGQVFSKDGASTLSTKRLVLAAGFQTYDLLKPITNADLGHGVKGHSALFKLDGVADQPILYDNGVYVVPHTDGTVAVGSTSENEWQGEHDVIEANCTPFIERAMELCPPLQNAELVSLWAGVRPRSFAKDPVVGALGKERNIFILTGGFKISFGIAHRLARALIERMTGHETPLALPGSYEVAYHLAEAIADNRGGS